jgi:hypothetical protein
MRVSVSKSVTTGGNKLFSLGAAPQTLRAAQQHTVTPVQGASGALVARLNRPPPSPRPRVLGTHMCPSLHPHRKTPSAFQVAFSPDTSSLGHPRLQSLSRIHTSRASRPPPCSLCTTRDRGCRRPRWWPRRHSRLHSTPVSRQGKGDKGQAHCSAAQCPLPPSRPARTQRARMREGGVGVRAGGRAHTPACIRHPCHGRGRGTRVRPAVALPSAHSHPRALHVRSAHACEKAVSTSALVDAPAPPPVFDTRVPAGEGERDTRRRRPAVALPSSHSHPRALHATPLVSGTLGGVSAAIFTLAPHLLAPPRKHSTPADANRQSNRSLAPLSAATVASASG